MSTSVTGRRRRTLRRDIFFLPPATIPATRMLSQPPQTPSEKTAGLDPFALFERWYAEAVAAAIEEPAAMALATATATGEPSVRMVLLRGFDPLGFVFFTNYRSRKAAELTENPRAALVLYWHKLDRQV